MADLRACVMVVLLVACDRAPREQPTPPRDAVVDARVDQERIDALDRLYLYFATTPRTKRSPVEANEQLTNAYREWIFAYGYARAGKPERVKDLVMTAKSRLAGVEDDPVHSLLAAAFAARVANPGLGAPPPAVEAQLGRLDRVERYKVDRLREASRALNPDEEVDAIAAFAKRRSDARGPQFERLRGVVDDAARSKLVESLFAALATVPEDDRLAVFVGLAGQCRRLPKALASRLLGVAVAQVELVRPLERARAYAALLGLAQVVDPTAIAAFAAQAGPSFAAADGGVLRPALVEVVRTIGKTHHAELAALWKQAEVVVDDPKRATPELKAAFAAGLVQLGDPRARAMLDEVAASRSGATLTETLERSRLLALAYAQLPSRAEALAAIEQLARIYPSMTDSFGTNSHYALSVLALVDLVVVGVVDE